MCEMKHNIISRYQKYNFVHVKLICRVHIQVMMLISLYALVGNRNPNSRYSCILERPPISVCSKISLMLAEH